MQFFPIITLWRQRIFLFKSMEKWKMDYIKYILGHDGHIFCPCTCDVIATMSVDFDKIWSWLLLLYQPTWRPCFFGLLFLCEEIYTTYLILLLVFIFAMLVEYTRFFLVSLVMSKKCLLLYYFGKDWQPAILLLVATLSTLNPLGKTLF